MLTHLAYLVLDYATSRLLHWHFLSQVPPPLCAADCHLDNFRLNTVVYQIDLSRYLTQVHRHALSCCRTKGSRGTYAVFATEVSQS